MGVGIESVDDDEEKEKERVRHIDGSGIPRPIIGEEKARPDAILSVGETSTST